MRKFDMADDGAGVNLQSERVCTTSSRSGGGGDKNSEKGNTTREMIIKEAR